ncbi:MAG: nuclear transport factor 2 family protein [Parachlamydiales bacterium]|nr:nuclear transport factor 2 family protein [Parachlamydiales bacterium]
MMTLQEISDRFEIMDLLVSYCTAIDKGDIDALDSIFVENAHIDYSSAGGPKGTPKLIKKFLKENLGNLPRQHILANFEIHLKGDHAKVRSLCHNPLEIPSGEVLFYGLWYHDRVVRIDGKWLFQEKVTEICYSWKLQPLK